MRLRRRQLFLLQVQVAQKAVPKNVFTRWLSRNFSPAEEAGVGFHSVAQRVRSSACVFARRLQRMVMSVHARWLDFDAHETPRERLAGFRELERKQNME